MCVAPRRDAAARRHPGDGLAVGCEANQDIAPSKPEQGAPHRAPWPWRRRGNAVGSGGGAVTRRTQVTRRRAQPRTRFTSGPAQVIASRASSRSPSIRMDPPSASISIRTTRPPRRRAIRAWLSSCARMDSRRPSTTMAATAGPLPRHPHHSEAVAKPGGRAREDRSAAADCREERGRAGAERPSQLASECGGGRWCTNARRARHSLP